MSRLTMLDLAKKHNSSKEVGLIEANLSAAPEMALIPARTISGTSFHTLLRVGLPTVEFTNVNQGVTPSKSRFESKLVECFPVRSAVEIDKALISADNPEQSLMTDESMGVAEAAMRLIGAQVYYGRNAAGDAKGFPGLIDIVANEMILDATGSTADSATSVYLVKFGIKDLQMIFGRNTVLTLPPFRDETLTDADGKKFDGKISHLTGWAGMQCTNPNSVVRICNITEQTGKGLTDALLAKALAKFPTGVRPDAIFLNRPARRMLQEDRASRTALRGTGKNDIGGGSAYVPTPTDFEGIPLVCTDSLVSTEAIVS